MYTSHMSDCHTEKKEQKKDCCSSDQDHSHHAKKKFDWLLWISTGVLVVSYLTFWLIPDALTHQVLKIFSGSVFELMNRMAWGLALGIVFVGILQKIPREFLLGVLGKGGSMKGIVRATAAGVLLDLCSHGVLLVGTQLYKKGASLGQVMAFLIASPWNSLSLTLVLWALVGLKWTLFLLVLSMGIGIFSGFLFDVLVTKGKLPKNPNTIDLPENFVFKDEVKKIVRQGQWHPRYWTRLFADGLKGSTMILRWIFFGVILAALIRAFVSPEHFATFFGPTLSGLGLTVLIATILEVCSEGSTPIAADLLTRAKAPGNAFAFLMTGVSTDYTEILALKETTRSWKASLFLPLITLPQVILLAWMLNGLSF